MNSADAPLPTAGEGRARQPRASHGAEIIKQRIKQGIYKPGEQLPSLRTLSSELNLSFPAVQRAVRQLERELLLESRHGVGIRVLDSADCQTTPLFFGFVQPYFSRFSLALQHYLEEALDHRSNLCVTKSAHNDPARERREIERLIKSGVNGLLIWPVDSDTNGEFLQEISLQLPMVLVDRTVEGVRAPSVVIDYEDGARQIVRRLHQRKLNRILVACDPAQISSFLQFKLGLREEAAALGIESSMTVVDYPIISLIEAAYRDEYQPADECYEYFASLVRGGQYDAFFCPQSEFFDQVFADSGRTEILNGIHAVTCRTLDGPPHSRRYFEWGIEEWVLDTAGMLVQALDLLQDMTLSRRPRKRTVRVPIRQRKV
jgi:DNA-binding LacI/PurR family transcriptional regulator